MSTQTIAVPAASDSWRGLRLVLPAIAVGLACFGVVFYPEIEAALRVWSTSTAYNHCYMVLPIAAYLAWERRGRLPGLPIQPIPAVALAALPLGLAWLVAERVGIMEGRQLVAVTLMELMFLGVLGWRMFKALAAPLLYLYFLVPFGAFLTPALQDFTAGFTTAGLNLIGIPNFSDGYTIEIPAGTFYVAEACAGLRFLIASVAFGVLYACLIYRSPWKRLTFVGVSIVVPIIANGFRALGIVSLGQVLGSAEAAAADHILYGWIFFSIVILLLVLCGLPFREDGAAEPAPRPLAPVSPPNLRMAFGAALAVAILAAIGPAVARGLDSVGQSAMVNAPTLDGTSCTTAPDASSAQTAGEGPVVLGSTPVHRYLCDDGRIALRLAMLPPRASPSTIIEAQRQMIGRVGTGEVDQRSLPLGPGAPSNWVLSEAEDSNDAIASAIWLDGHAAKMGLTSRIAQARNSLIGSVHAPVIAVVSLVSDPAQQKRRGAGQAIQQFLQSQPALSDGLGNLDARSSSQG